LFRPLAAASSPRKEQNAWLVTTLYVETRKNRRYPLTEARGVPQAHGRDSGIRNAGAERRDRRLDMVLIAP
jgi:hypothetical protein